MKQKETNVWRTIILESQKLGYRLFRNQRYKGKTDKGAWVDCGVGSDGGSDLIGYKITTITQEMVGRRVAVFVAIETKSKGGYERPEQKRFLAAVNNNGGIGLLTYGIDDLINTKFIGR